MDRRDLLKRSGLCVATVVASGIAGCTGDDGAGGDDEPDGEMEGDTGDGDDDDMESEADEGPDDDISNYDPADIAVQYYEALNAGDEDTLTELSHSQGVAIANVSFNADAWGDQEEINIKDGEVVREDIEYFFYPSAVVNLSFDRVREETSDLPDSDYVILAVEDEDLRVFDTNSDEEVDTGEPDGPCPPEDDTDAMANLPRTGESFYSVDRDSSFDSADGYYRGPDGDRFNVEIEVHDTEEEAQEVDTGGISNYNRNGESWEAVEYFVARDENVTCEIDVDNSAVAEQIDQLYQEVNCFNDEHIVDRTY